MSVVIKLEERPAKISNKNNKKEHTRREGCNKNMSKMHSSQKFVENGNNGMQARELQSPS
jgi:hypothetical protein